MCCECEVCAVKSNIYLEYLPSKLNFTNFKDLLIADCINSHF